MEGGTDCSIRNIRNVHTALGVAAQMCAVGPTGEARVSLGNSAF